MTWAPDYVTAAELKAYLRISDTEDDAQIALAVTTASRSVDKTCARQFGQLAAATAWLYTLAYDRHRGVWFAPIDDVATQTGMIIALSGTAVTDYRLEPVQAVAKGRVWTDLVLGSTVTGTGDEYALSVTATFGWPAVPAAVQQATLLQASRVFARRESPYGIAGSPDAGSEMRLLASVDPDVRVALDPYLRRVWAL